MTNWNPQNLENYEYSGLNVLHDLESNLSNYNELIFKLIRRNWNSNQKLILDFGAGSGTLSDLWKDSFGISPDCVEIDPKLLNILRKKGFKAEAKVEELKNRYDFVFTSNVLEHIEEDSIAVKQIFKCMNGSGRLVVYVPAFPILYTEFDRVIGHYRRYTKKSLKKLLEENGFTLVSIKYNDSLGFILTLIVRGLSLRAERVASSKVILKVYNSLILPLSRLLDLLGARFVFGKNLIAVADKI
jgi:SAM-dependent methyltransferase